MKEFILFQQNTNELLKLQKFLSKKACPTGLWQEDQLSYKIDKKRKS